MRYLKNFWVLMIVLTPVSIFASDGGHVSISGFFWRVFMFAVFAGLLYKLLNRRVQKGLASSIENVKQSIADAEKACADADAELAEYTRKMTGMTKELEVMKASARNTAEKEVEIMLAEAEEAAKKYREMAKSTIAAETAKAIADLKAEIGFLAIQNAETILKNDHDQKSKQKYIADAITKIGA